MPVTSSGIGIELRVYNKLDPTVLIDIVNDRIDPQYLEELRGPGGGSFRIRVSDPKLLENPTLLDPRNLVQVRIDNRVVGAWLIKRTNNKLIGAGEFAEQMYEVSGPGIKEWLKDAVVYPVDGNLSDVGGSRNFNFASVRGTWYNPTDWTVPVSMNRKDAGKLLAAIMVANPVRYGVIDDAPTKSPDGYPRANNGWKNGYMMYGSTTPVRTGWGFIAAGNSKYWWDANGWHDFTSITDPDPPPTTPEGGTKYPATVSPGIVVYGYINPVTGTWTDVGVDAATTEIITNTISKTYWSPSANALRVTGDNQGRTTSPPGKQSVPEPAPTGWSDYNPWRYAPSEWPDAPHARWIWDRDTRFSVSGQRAPIGDVYFRREFTVTVETTYALYVAADNQFTAYMDAQPVMSSTASQNASSRAMRVDLTLKPGSHVLGIKATNWEVGTAGLLVALMQAGDADVPSSSVPVLVSGDSGWLCRGYPATAPGWTVGEVLRTLVGEAAARGVNAMTRLTYSFTDSHDSEGVAWPAPIEWSFDLGTDYAEVVSKMEELACDIRLRMTQEGTFVLDAFIEQGSDKGDPNGAAVITLRPAHNVIDSNEDAEYDLKNALLMASTEGWFQAADSYSSIPNYGRIEGFLNVSGTLALAQLVAVKTIEKMSIPTASTSIMFVPVEDGIPWQDFFVGDWVLGPTKDKKLVRRRVMSLALSETAETNQAAYAAEFDTVSKDRTDKIERWLRSTADGTLGGTVANSSGGGASATTPVSSISGALGFAPHSNTDMVGQIIDAANIIDGTLIASDKVVANTITADLIQANTISAFLIIGNTIATATEDDLTWPARAQMDSTGFHTFDALGIERFTADNEGNVFLAGDLTTGIAPEGRVEISDSSVIEGLQVPRVAFYSGIEEEVSPFYVTNYYHESLGFPIVHLEGPRLWDEIGISSFGVNQFLIVPSRASDAGGWIFQNSLGSNAAQVDCQASVYMRLYRQSPTAATIAFPDAGGPTPYSTNPSYSQSASEFHPLGIGGTSVDNLAIDRFGLQARLATTLKPAPLFLNYDGGCVLINANPAGGAQGVVADASLSSTAHPFQIGQSSQLNMIMDNNEIMCRNNGAASDLHINSNGGLISINSQVASVDVSLADTAGAFLIGRLANTNLVFDDNEIQARNNGAASTLTLQASGGSVTIGSSSLDTATLTVWGELRFRTMRIDDVSITPSAANTPTALTVTGLGLLSGPVYRAQVTARTTVPGTVVLGVGYSALSNTQVTLYVTRTNTTATSVSYFIGPDDI